MKLHLLAAAGTANIGILSDASHTLGQSRIYPNNLFWHSNLGAVDQVHGIGISPTFFGTS
jgi:hypothetical protein